MKFHPSHQGEKGEENTEREGEDEREMKEERKAIVGGQSYLYGYRSRVKDVF